MTNEEQLIRQHYQNENIKNAIIGHATFTGDSFRCLNGDFSHWYKPKGENVTLYDGSNGKDYDLITSKYRTLYWSLNFFHPNVKLTEIPKSLHDEQGNKVSIGDFSNTNTMSLGIDIDAIGDITKPDIKKAVEQMAQFCCTIIRKHCPKSVYACFSGGGIYIYIHHGIFLKNFQNDTNREISWRILTGCYNTYIKDLEQHFFKKYPQHKGKVKADAINNQKRVFKTIFSVHKNQPFAVVPLNVKNIHINFEDATLPLSKKIIGEGNKWMQTYDTNEAHNIMIKLKQYEDTTDITIPDDEPIDVPQLSKKAHYKFFPPCIKKIINTKRQEGASRINGATRMKTLIAIFLGQAGYSREGSLRIFKKVSNRLGGPESNIFDSWFQKMHCPSCKKIRKKGGGFPHLYMGELNICKPDKICKHIDSPYEYIKEKARFGLDESKSATSKRLELLEKYHVFEKKEDRKTGKLVKTGQVNCPNLAKLLMEADNRRYIVTKDNQGIYMWNGRYYEPTGKQEIETRVNYYLDIDCKDYRQREVVKFIRTHKYIDREELDPPEYLINVKNGIYNRKTKELMPHTPDIYFLYEIPWNYNPKAKIKKIKDFLETAMNLNDIPSVQEFIGDCLQPTYKYKKAVICIGPTDSRKSQLLSLIGVFLGRRNISHVALPDLCDNKFASIDLYGKLANICAEISIVSIQSINIFLMLTGGDWIRGEKKHQDAFDFLNYAKMIFSCNEMPEVTTKAGPAYYKRWIIWYFDVVVPKKDRIPYFYTTLIDDEEMSGLLNWALEGLERLEKTGIYTEYRTTEDVRRFMLMGKNPIDEFARDNIESDEDGEITKKRLYKYYMAFCKFFKYPIKADNVFSREIKQYLPGDYEEGQSGTIKGRPKVWRGIRCTWLEENKPIFTESEEKEIGQIIKNNPDDNYILLTDKYGVDRIGKAIESHVFIEHLVGKKLEFNPNPDAKPTEKKTDDNQIIDDSFKR